MSSNTSTGGVTTSHYFPSLITYGVPQAFALRAKRQRGGYNRRLRHLSQE